MMKRCRRLVTAAVAAFVFVPYAALASPLYDMDFDNTPLKNALIGIGYQSGQNIIVNGDLSGSVSMNIRQKTVEDILSLLATTNGFSYRYDGDTILVSPPDQMTEIKSYPVKYLDLETARQQLALYMPPEKILINAEDATLTIDGSPSQHKKAAQHLAAMDKPVQQIEVNAAIIEFTQSKARDLGLDFGLDSYMKGNKGLNYVIASSQEETYGKGNVLARPSVVVANAHEASILMGDKVPVFTSESSEDESGGSTVSVEYKDVGVTLRVLPRINDLEKGLITLVLRPEISSITKWVESGNNKAPQISSRELETVIRVKSGQTIVIGGLLKDEEIKNIKALPLFSKLPVLGHLFKNTSTTKAKTEICIAITPEIILDEDGVPTVAFKGSKETRNQLEAEAKKQGEGNQPETKAGFSEEQAEIERLKQDLQAAKAEKAKLQEEHDELTGQMGEMENLINAYIASDYKDLKD